MKEKKIIIQTVVVIVLVGLLIVLFGKKEGGNVPENGSPTATSTGTVTEIVPGVGISGDGDYTIEVENLTAKAPSLDRVLIGEAGKVYPKDVQEALLSSMRSVIDVLKKDPTQLDYWLELGNLRKQAGDFDGAIAIWEYLIKITPSNYVYYSNIGNAYHYDLKNYPKAEEYLKKVIEINPGYIIGYRDLSDLYRLSYKKETTLATDVLKNGLVKNPNAIDLLMPLGVFYRDTGDKAAAVKYFEQALTEARRLKNGDLITFLEKEIASLK